MRFRFLLPAAVLLCATAAARADDFAFTLNGSAAGFSGSGVFRGDPIGNGGYRITDITGAGITGLIDPGSFFPNDNLLFPSGTPVVDTGGISFVEQNGTGVFQVNLASSGGGLFVNINEINTSTPFSTRLPVTATISSAAATPEPSSLLLLGSGVLALAGAARRRLRA